RHEVATRVADDRNSEFFDLGDDVLSKSIRVGKLRTRVVDAVVDGAPQVFQKGSEEILVNRADLASGIDIHLRGGHAACARLRRDSGASKEWACHRSKSGSASLLQETPPR